MNPQWLIYLLIGCSAGVLSGLVGIGGGIIIVPALMLLAGFPQLTASGTSLAVLLLPVGLMAVAQYYKDGHVDVSAALVIALSFAFSAWLGVLLAKKISPYHLRLFFAAVLILVGIYIAYSTIKKW